MRTMLDTKHAGSIKSMRHVATRATTSSKDVPHLNLYVLQMNLYKLNKERKATRYRLEELDKQIANTEEKILSLKPNIMAGFKEKTKRGGRRSRRGNSGGNGRKRVLKKVRVNY